jgi:small neutral amino acid transporter SnatA (MarC family)
MSNAISSTILIAIGFLALLGAALNWRIVSHSGRILNRLLGDTVARAVYGVVGLVLIVLGGMRLLE